jgi:hypothetical protein
MTLSVLQSQGWPFLLKLLVSLAGLGAVARYWYVVGLGEGRRLAPGLTVHVNLDPTTTLDACEQCAGNSSGYRRPSSRRDEKSRVSPDVRKDHVYP